MVSDPGHPDVHISKVDYDPECKACTYDEMLGEPYYDDHVHKTDVYPRITTDEWGDAFKDANPGIFETKDSGQREQYASGMVRDVTDGKTKWHLIASGPMLQRWAELMTRGAEKYDDDNWMHANSLDEYTRFRQSAYRHFMQWYMGHDDEDHGAAVIFNINGAEYTKDMIT